jgi:hypothetical protein
MFRCIYVIFKEFVFLYAAVIKSVGIQNKIGVRGGAVVEALRYKPEGRGFDSRWCHWNFSLT